MHLFCKQSGEGYFVLLSVSVLKFHNIHLTQASLGRGVICIFFPSKLLSNQKYSVRKRGARPPSFRWLTAVATALLILPFFEAGMHQLSLGKVFFSFSFDSQADKRWHPPALPVPKAPCSPARKPDRAPRIPFPPISPRQMRPAVTTAPVNILPPTLPRSPGLFPAS